MLTLTLFGGFSLTDSDGVEIPLKSRKAKALLAYLACSDRKSRSREEIMAMLWSDREEAQARGSLRQVLSGLRKELGENVLRIDNDAVGFEPGAISLAEASGGEFLAGFHLNGPAFENWLRDERLRYEDAVPSAPLVSSLPDKPSIAVLPFENMSKDSDQDYFSDGITQDIITELSRFRDLFIIAPRTTFQFKDKPISSYDVGKGLEADYIVEGSVRRAGDRVRITVQLIETETETHIWADRFDRDLEDVFAIQEEVAQEIAAAVPSKIAEVSFERVLNRSSQNFTAYEYVLRGEWHSGQDYGSSQAVLYFEKAIAADPSCARAQANLSAWHAYSAYFPPTSFEDVQSKVRTYSDRALIAEPNDPIILMSVAYAYLLIGDFDLSRKYITKAVRINPNHYAVMRAAAVIMAWLGEPEKSLEWLECFTRHDPLSQAAYDEIGLEVYYLAERYDDAIVAMAGWKDLPIHVAATLAAAHAQAGRLGEAKVLRERFEVEAPPGHSFEDTKIAMLRICARERERELLLEGYRNAGFAV